MKKFQFRVFAIMIMALVCVGFASCGSDDDDSKNKSNNTSDLVGIWAQYHQGVQQHGIMASNWMPMEKLHIQNGISKKALTGIILVGQNGLLKITC